MINLLTYANINKLHLKPWIAETLAQSPDMQELAKQDCSYFQSYSQFCQSQATTNQLTWQNELNQHRSAVESGRQRQEQRRIALERQQ